MLTVTVQRDSAHIIDCVLTHLLSTNSSSSVCHVATSTSTAVTGWIHCFDLLAQLVRDQPAAPVDHTHSTSLSQCGIKYVYLKYVRY